MRLKKPEIKDVIHTHFVDKLALLNGFISGVALYPQLFKTMISGITDGLSETTLFIIFMNNIVWAIYSIHRWLISLLIASLLNMLAAGVLFLILFAL